MTLGALSWLGDDTATLVNEGFTSSQVQTIMGAAQSGALSADGYQQLISGNVDPSQLPDFLAADLGAQQQGASLSEQLLIGGLVALFLIASVKGAR